MDSVEGLDVAQDKLPQAARRSRKAGLIAAGACVCYYGGAWLWMILLLSSPNAAVASVFWVIHAAWDAFGLIAYGLIAWAGFYLALVNSCADVKNRWPQAGIESFFWPLLALLSLAAAPLVALSGWIPP